MFSKMLNSSQTTRCFTQTRPPATKYHDDTLSSPSVT